MADISFINKYRFLAYSRSELFCEVAVAKKLEHISENVRGGVLFDSVMVMFFSKYLLERTVTLKIPPKNM